MQKIKRNSRFFQDNFDKRIILILLFQLQYRAQPGCNRGSGEHCQCPQEWMGLNEGARRKLSSAVILVILILFKGMSLTQASQNN